MASEGYDIKDIQDRVIFDDECSTLPPDFDPDSIGGVDLEVGKHPVRIVSGKLIPDKVWKWKGEEQTACQLEVHLEITAGKCKGGRVVGFLPFPTKGVKLMVGLASQWYQAAKAFGLNVTKERCLPPGTKKLSDLALIGRECVVSIVYRTDRDGVIQKWPNGKPKHQIDLFGYFPEGTDTAPADSAPEPAESGKGKGGKKASKKADDDDDFVL